MKPARVMLQIPVISESVVRVREREARVTAVSPSLHNDVEFTRPDSLWIRAFRRGR
jgi:hypothetical protein